MGKEFHVEPAVLTAREIVNRFSDAGEASRFRFQQCRARFRAQTGSDEWVGEEPLLECLMEYLDAIAYLNREIEEGEPTANVVMLYFETLNLAQTLLSILRTRFNIMDVTEH